ncbi:glutathione peroxidase [Ferruginibacter lapsinanis]|uniref:glutathione peroxidase n=1 Tax=Ferruginibacter lapsinanis TaxID=563172 RepID=UPI001E3640DD|nr:glutathione peroxidase [Ferruginibacter lapsinanis]UEG51011.1 glutathione peroxidase [Ferruginibacter lapsinanis]
MTIRQKFLQLVYPIWMFIARLKPRVQPVQANTRSIQPIESFYNLKAVQNDRVLFSFSLLKNKKVLIVNTASDCGYTNQYSDLEKLYQLHKDELVILAFPSNNFKGQEKGTDEEILVFCKTNFGITFPIMQKTTVTKRSDQHEVYQWLTDATKNGWNNQWPTWNFSKYLINENGVLTHYFEPSVSPLSEEVERAIKA